VLQGKAEVVQRALEVQSLPGALPVQMVQPPNGE
jgi:6-phosphogluconolactonase